MIASINTIVIIVDFFHHVESQRFLLNLQSFSVSVSLLFKIRLLSAVPASSTGYKVVIY